jgi:hypothetical protein
MKAYFSVPGLLSGHQAEVQCHRVQLAMQCQMLSVLPGFAQYSLCGRVLAQQRFAEVHQVVSQGAPQRHAFDFVQAAHRERCQPTISS